MSARLLHPFGACLLALVLLPFGSGCERPDPQSSPSTTDATRSTAPTASSPAVPDSLRADSLTAALNQFAAARPPSRADSTVLRRWGDSLAVKGRSLWGRTPTKARGHLRQALQAYRRLADSAAMAEVIGDVGVTYFFQSRYEEALARYRKALRISRQAGVQAEIAASLNNIGLIYKNQGRYEEALGRLRKTLARTREMGNRRRTAHTLNNIGNIHRVQGRYEEALTHYREALALKREIGNQNDIATTLNNIGIVYKNQGQYEEALTYYRESLSIKREIGDREGVATTVHNIGIVRKKQGRPEAALARYRESLRIKRETGDRGGIANSLHDVGEVYRRRGRYDEALDHYRAALRLNREIGRQRGAAFNLEDIGIVHLEQGRLQAAIDTLDQSVRRAEELRLNATSPEARRSLLSTQIGAYRALTSAHVRAGRPDSALHAAEQARARLLADRLAGTARTDTTFSVPSPSTLRRTVGPDEAAVLYANAGPQWPLTALLVTRDTTVARELPDARVRATVGQTYAAQLRRLRQSEGPLTAPRSEETISARDNRPRLASTIRLYRSYLTREASDDSIQHDLAHRLHDLLVAPIEDQLQAIETVTVAPTGALGYLPFETLRDSTGQYLVQQAHVRYAQSLTVLRQLQERTYPSSRQPLLAVGGAAYGGDAPNTDAPLLASLRGRSTIGSETQAAALYRSAEQRIERGQSPRPTYRQLGYDQWPPLYGTKLEVRKLKRAVGNGTTLLTGTDASEDRIRKMSTSGQLAQYRYLHFATHGIAMTEAPELSALVLSQTNVSNSLATRDGYLTMREIANLQMRADVAVLSACRTGIGRIVAGEGVVSLSHAFLRGGANATLVSQWRVLDWSTQQFMTAVHRTARKTDTTFAAAVTQIKRDFINGTFGERNTDPLRWAPFVYYGRE